MCCEGPGQQAEEDQVITEREGEQTDQESENDEAAAATHSTGFDLGDRDTGPRQIKLRSHPHHSFGMQKQAFHHSCFEKHNNNK